MSSLEILRYLYDREEMLNHFPNTGFHRLHVLDPGRACIASEIDAKAIVVECLEGGALPVLNGQMTREGQELNLIGMVYYYSPENRGKLSQVYKTLCEFCGELEITSYVYWISGTDRRIKEMVEDEAEESGIKFELRLPDVVELLVATRGWASRIVPVEIKSEILAFNHYLKAREELMLYGIEPQEDHRTNYRQSMRETDAKLIELEEQKYTATTNETTDYLVKHEILKKALRDE